MNREKNMNELRTEKKERIQILKNERIRENKKKEMKSINEAKKKKEKSFKCQIKWQQEIKFERL